MSIVAAGDAMQKIKDYGVQVGPLPKEIEDAFLAAAGEYITEKKATEGANYAAIADSQLAFKVLAESQGIY